ncbi:hypothetical protein [Stenotrophomonas sp.]|uniref:hypothetical protein n=1 Tax=Stenotrophomonas sp. TaxID=69392 RepID=UPI0028B0CED2|nr:hypothetical protein [Stenotrophomonas sp.]
MTTFAGWVQSTYAMIKHPLRGQKYDLKRAQEPVVRGFSRAPTERAKWVSDFPLTTLNNRTVRQYSEDKASGTAPIVATSPKRAMSPPSAVSNPVRTDDHRSWLHDSWKPRQVKAGIDFFERVAAASVQGAPAQPASPAASIKVKRPASPPPAPPKPVVVSRHGKTKRAPQPPHPMSAQAKMPTAPRGPDSTRPSPQPPAQNATQPTVTENVTAPTKTFTPPPAPPMDGLKALQRANSAPPLSPPNMAAVFAELKGHKLVQRSDSAPETMGTASETRAASAGRRISAKSWLPRTNGPMDATLQELKSSKRMPKEAKPIEVKPEVKRQAEELRERREALQRDSLMLKPWRGAQQAGQESNLSASETFNALRPLSTTQVNLRDELVKAQVALGLRTRTQQAG